MVVAPRILQCFFLSFMPIHGEYYNNKQPVGQPQAPLPGGTELFDTVREALKKSTIIPEVLDDFTPRCYITPYYTKKHRSVSLGNELNPSKVQSAPSLRIRCPHVKWESVKGLTIAMTDPDAPSRGNPTWSQVCHWIAQIPLDQGNRAPEEIEMSIAKGGVDDLVEYKSPGPPPKTGFHRYIFVLLEGENKNLSAPEERRQWGTGEMGYGVRDWAEQEGLEVLGANFFVSENKRQ